MDKLYFNRREQAPKNRSIDALTKQLDAASKDLKQERNIEKIYNEILQEFVEGKLEKKLLLRYAISAAASADKAAILLLDTLDGMKNPETSTENEYRTRASELRGFASTCRTTASSLLFG